MKIKDIKKLKDGEVIEGEFLISDMRLVNFSNKPGVYLSFNLKDNTGSIESKIWNDAETLEKKLKDIKVVFILGIANVFNDKVQIIVNKIKKNENENVGSFISASEKDVEEMWKELNDIAHTLSTNYKKVWSLFLDDMDFVEMFKTSSASRVSYNFKHGLLEHTLNVLKSALLCGENFDRDILILGSILHDIGTIEAFFYVGDILELTNMCKMHHPCVLGYYKFRRIVEESDIALRNKKIIIEEIGHIILSNDFPAMTIETKIINFCDKLDFEKFYIQKKLCFSEDGWVFSKMHDQHFYRRPVQLIKRK